jgi:NAD(P)-dependent dehydrogenase (short-subunit alcohol dehydrogenase family)
MKKDITVITGCDSGIGKACAEILLRKGAYTAMSYLETDHFENEPLCFAYKADMTKESDIEKFAKSIKKLCASGYSLKSLFCNAGVALGGPVENTPLEVYRRVFEINYFSYVSLIQKLIPLLRESRGMIMIHGSLAGRIALPFLAPYTSSKFALEAFADSLRREMNPFGIKTVLLETAAVATPIWTKARKIDNSFVDEVYMDSLNAFMENFVDSGSRGMAVDKAAEKIVRIMDMEKPRTRYIISGTPVNSFLQTVLPDRVVDRMVKKFFRKNYG